MKKIENFIKDPLFKIFLSIGIYIGILEWIIFPLLTVAETFLNMVGIFLLMVLVILTIRTSSYFISIMSKKYENQDVNNKEDGKEDDI